MKIGIDASRAFVEQRTGIEEYSYHVIKHLRDKLDGHQVILYVKKGARSESGVFSGGSKLQAGIFSLPRNWSIKEIPFDYLWTQVGLSWEMLTEPVDVLFVPAHTIPWIHPVRTIVTIHGLEYEHCPDSYTPYSRRFHRFFVKKSCAWASKIIAVSKHTKQDLITLYGVSEEKIEVIYNGYNERPPIINSQSPNEGQHSKYILYVGRLEKRKNIGSIIQAFEILKTQYGYQGQLFLVGKPGIGYERVKQEISTIKHRHDVVEKGFVSEEEKWSLLSQADIFLFPSLCEGFGLPILEAQSVGTPVITSSRGPMDEVADNNDILVDPEKPDAIAAIMNRLLSDQLFRRQVVSAGLKNIQRFSWDRCACYVARALADA